MQNFNLNKIIVDNLEKDKFQSKSSSRLPVNGWLDKYAEGGVTTQTTTPPSTQDSVRHLAGQTMDYEYKKGSPSGTGLSDWGYHASQLPTGKVPANWHAPQTKEQAVDMYMQEIGNNPLLGYFNSAMEKGEAGDFLYNTGRDARVYMLDQYLKSKGQSGLPNRGSYNVDTKTDKWTPELQGSLDQIWNQYSPEINKLPVNQRRILLNKGRDFYYQNINKQADGSPNPSYEATWKPRIWESVNTYKKNGGSLNGYGPGPKALPPIYTNNPRKVRAYNDSLNLYNSGEDYYNRLKKLSFDSKEIGVTENNLKKAREETYKKYPYDKLNMPASNYKAGKKFQPSSKYDIYVSDVGNLQSNRYKKPVQPYILQQKPSLQRRVSDVQPIDMQHDVNVSGITTLQHPPTSSRPLPEGNYMLGYHDENNQGVDRGFITPEQRADFIKDLQSRNLSGVQPYMGNITEYYKTPSKKEYGGGEAHHGYYNKYGGDISIPDLDADKWLKKYAPGGVTSDPNKPYSKSNPQGYFSMKNNQDWFDNHANWTDTGNQKWDAKVRQQILTGRFGVDPNSGALIKLPQNEWTKVSEEDKRLATDIRQWTPAQKQISWEKKVKPYIVQSTKDLITNPVMMAPGAILTGGMLSGIPAIAETAAAIAPALETSIGGVPGLTAGNLLNAGFAYQGAKNIPNVYNTWKDVANKPTWNNIGNATAQTATTALDIAPFLHGAAKGIPSVIQDVNQVGNYLTTQTPLNNAWKLNPSAGKIPFVESKPNWLTGWSKDYNNPTKIDFSSLIEMTKPNALKGTRANRQLEKLNKDWINKTINLSEEERTIEYKKYNDEYRKVMNQGLVDKTGLSKLFDVNNMYGNGVYSDLVVPLKSDPNIILKLGRDPFAGQTEDLVMRTQLSKLTNDPQLGLPFYSQQISNNRNVSLMPKVLGEGKSFGIHHKPTFEIPRDAAADMAWKLRKLRSKGIYPEWKGDNFMFDPKSNKLSVFDLNTTPPNTLFGETFATNSNKITENPVTIMKQEWPLSAKGITKKDIKQNVTIDDPVFKNVFDKDHPYYSPNNVSVQTKGRNLNYDQTIDLIHDQFTKHPELAAGNYPLYFHGSSSASLPGFVQDKGLVPLGHLLEQGRAPLTGEIVFGGTGINKDHISTTFLRNLKDPISYAGAATKSKIDPALDLSNWLSGGKKDWLKKYGKGIIGDKTDLLDDLISKRVTQWEKMSDVEKQIAQENFPVMYGIKPKAEFSSGTDRFKNVSSDISDEVGFKGNIGHDEIPSMFVPKSKIDLVSKFIGNDKIHVLPMDDIITKQNRGVKPEWFTWKHGGSTSWLKKYAPGGVTGDPNQPYHPILNPDGYRPKISDVLKAAQKREQEASDTRPTIKQGHKELPYEKRAREQRLREQAQQNSELAQTMGLFTPSGSNTAAGAIGANDFVNINPLITGPIMSASRLYGAGRSMFDPNTYNPYFGSDKGVAGNIMGGLQLAGDIGMLHTSLRKPTGDINPSIDVSNETYWPDFSDRNARVKEAWFNNKKQQAGIPTSAEEYRKLLQQQKLKQEAGDILRTEGQPDPSIGGWSPTNNPETNRMVGLAQYGKPQQLNNLDFVTNEQLINEQIFKDEFDKHIKHYMDMGYHTSDAVEQATNRTLDVLKDHPNYDHSLGIERTLQRLTRGPNTYNPFSKDFRPEFLWSQKPLGSQAKGVMRANPSNIMDANFSINDPNIKVFGDKMPGFNNQNNINLSSIKYYEDLLKIAEDPAVILKIKEKLGKLYQKIPNSIPEGTPYTGTKAFNTLTPNKFGGSTYARGGTSRPTHSLRQVLTPMEIREREVIPEQKKGGEINWLNKFK